MPTLTIFAYGTGESDEKTNTIISQFRHACADDPLSEASKLEERITANKGNKHFQIKGPNPLGTDVIPHATTATEKILEWLQGQEEKENIEINLTGFSRGSVTCIHIANMLKEKLLAIEERMHAGDKKLLTQLRKINLNMFLLDPVAGLKDKSAINGRVIPDNVKNCVAMLQKDERRREFKPQDMSRIIIASPEKTKVSMLPMYGNHSDVIKIQGKERKVGMESGPKLAWYSLYQFLTQHGTKFKADKIPQITTSLLDKILIKDGFKYKKGEQPQAITIEERDDLPPTPDVKGLLLLFSQNHEQRKEFYQSGITARLIDGIPAPRAERTLNKHEKYYVKNPDFFVNQLERELFKIAYPKTFNYLFERNLKDDRFPEDSHCSKEKVILELGKILMEDPELFKRLKAKGVTIEDVNITLGEPGGCYTLEPCISMQQIYPDLLPPEVINEAEKMNKLASLEMEVYRLTFQYQREMIGINFFGGRSHSSRATQIREEINDIVNQGIESRDEKFKLILDKLELHYKELILSGNFSDLGDKLKRVLANNGRRYVLVVPSTTGGIATEEMAYTIRDLLTLIKETVKFVGHLGYIGGGILFGVGAVLESIGSRGKELLGEVGINPFKGLAWVIASLIQGMGILIKNSFGLKPLTEFIANGIAEIRDAFVLLATTSKMKMERIDVKPKSTELSEETLESELVTSSEPQTGRKNLTFFSEKIQIHRSEGGEPADDEPTATQTPLK